MANTFTQIHIHIIFAVQGRASIISSEWEQRLYDYIIAIAHENGHKVLSINGMPDHLHILIGLMPNQALSELVKKIKSSTSKWLNEQKIVHGKFSWQEGYAAFAISKSRLPAIIKYIQDQKSHHKKHSFIEEYRKILDYLNIEYDDKYIFKPAE